MDLRANDGHGEACSVELADGTEGCRVCVLVALAATEAVLGVRRSSAERSLNAVTLARRRAVTCKDGDGDEGAAAKEVEEHGKERKDLLAAEEACEQDREDGVQHNRAGHALDSLLPARDGDIAVRLHREEVAVDAEDDSGAAELERIQDGRAEPQESAADSHCEGRVSRGDEVEEL
jgi:hypothetical protein